MSNPFIITGPAVINFSGGRTSAMMLHRILEAHQGDLPHDVHVCFQNTGCERRETLKFVDDCSKRFHKHVIWQEYVRQFDIAHYAEPYVVNGKDGPRSKHPLAKPTTRMVSLPTAQCIHPDMPFESWKNVPFIMMIMWMKEYRAWKKSVGYLGKTDPVLPNPAQRVCTNELKMKTAHRWMRERGYRDYTSVLGIRIDEPKRLAKGRSGQFGEADFPLASAGITKDDVKAFWRGMPFDLDLDPESDEGNCTLCFMKKREKIEAIMRRTTEHDWFWIKAEELTGQTFRRDRPTYAQMRANLPIVPQSYDEDDVGDCFCGTAA